MSLCVVMPAWNECEGIGGFLEELNAALLDRNPTFIVIDDCSTDSTREVIEVAGRSGIRVLVETN